MRKKAKFSIISIIILVLVLTTNMHLLEFVASAEDFITVEIKQYGGQIQDIELDWNGHKPISSTPEQTIQLTQEDYNHFPKVTSTTDQIEYQLDRSTKTLYVFKLQNYYIEYDKSEITHEDMENTTISMEYTKVLSKTDDGNLGTTDVTITDPSNNTAPSSVDEMNEKIFTIDKEDNISITSEVQLQPDYRLVRLSGYGQGIVVNNVNTFLTKLDFYTIENKYDFEVTKANDLIKVKFKYKTPLPSEPQVPTPADPEAKVQVDVEYFGDEPREGKLFVASEFGPVDIPLPLSSINNFKTQIEMIAKYLTRELSISYISAESNLIEPDVIISPVDKKMHISSKEPFYVNIEYINIDPEDVKNTSLRIDSWKEVSNRLPKTLINDPPKFNGPSEGGYSSRPTIKEKITKNPLPENIIYTKETLRTLDEANILTGMRLQHIIKPRGLEEMPIQIDFDTLNYGFKPYVLSTSVDRSKIDVSYNPQTHTLTLKKKTKTVIPWTPLTPAKKVIPATPLVPAKKIIPWTPLTPAKKTIPWTPLTPAQPSNPGNPSTPLIPLKPAETIPNVPNNPHATGGGGGGNPTPKPKPKPSPEPEKPKRPNKEEPKKDKPERERDKPEREKDRFEKGTPEQIEKPEYPIAELPDPLVPLPDELAPVRPPEDIPTFKTEDDPDTPKSSIPTNPKAPQVPKKDDDSKEFRYTKKNEPIKKKFDIDISEDEEVKIISNPSHGTVQVSQGTAGFIYTPNHNYLGSDRFEIKVSRRDGTFHTHTVLINVFDEESPKGSPRLPMTGTKEIPEEIMYFWGFLILIAVVVYYIAYNDIEKKKKESQNNKK